MLGIALISESRYPDIYYCSTCCFAKGRRRAGQTEHFSTNIASSSSLSQGTNFYVGENDKKAKNATDRNKTVRRPSSHRERERCALANGQERTRSVSSLYFFPLLIFGRAAQSRDDHHRPLFPAQKKANEWGTLQIFTPFCSTTYYARFSCLD